MLRESGACGISLEPAGSRGDRTEPMLAGGCGDLIESVFAGELPCSRGAPLSGESGAVIFMPRPIVALSPTGGRGERKPGLAGKRFARGTESDRCPVEDTVGRGGEEIRYPVSGTVGGGGDLTIGRRFSYD